MKCVMVDKISSSEDSGGNENGSPYTVRDCRNLRLNTHSRLQNSHSQCSLSRSHEAGMHPLKSGL